MFAVADVSPPICLRYCTDPPVSRAWRQMLRFARSSPFVTVTQIPNQCKIRTYNTFIWHSYET
ncbi:hypothetical protein Ga0080574_TMP343 (plasmid) [Salipiger abyssi]|uniref:Uncharacterized protein n=1 Tax=Salipiger abyssi TaxID=1250539 RepID=A0A1P8UMS3_9RHOB|nr:hypothetical protein Ga0080574_TMP343 [Salipiger abyssi]